uniref:Spermatogenesis-associated protein 17 n=1 Tax=Bactrocera dorsalis TaxID=27457 RepID=A0A034WFS9_BACDO
MTSTKRSVRQSHKKPVTHEVKDVESGIPLRTLESIYDTKQMFFSQEDFQGWYEEMWSTSDIKQKSKMQLSRTSLLRLDYLQFKAARTIQKYLRRWYYQRIYQRKRTAAIRIQFEWRKFYRRHHTYRKLEEETQAVVEQYYFRQAQKIQALWRGWYTRQYIHDHSQLLKSQVLTAEELLQCVAFKLHHMLRTYQIPGVYSLRNSHCLSKVEKLLAAMSFKQHNKYVRQLRAKLDNQTNIARKKFEHSSYNTLVPYPGPNVHGYCDPKCEILEKSKDVDRRMYNILNMYEQAAKAQLRDKHRAVKKRHRSVERKEKKTAASAKSKLAQRKSSVVEKETDFCEDIVNSMKRWSILRDNNVTVDPDIFRRPEMLENFLHEIESIYNMMQEHCHCKIKILEQLCH